VAGPRSSAGLLKPFKLQRPFHFNHESEGIMLTPQESAAALRVLICIAKADGQLSEAERHSIQSSMAGLPLPEGVALSGLLDGKFQLKEVAQPLTGPEARERAFEAAFALAGAEGGVSQAERKALEELRALWSISADRASEIERTLALADVEKAAAEPTAEPAADRAGESHKLITKYCIMTAITGAVPVPLIADLMVVPMQLKMVYSLGRISDHTFDKATVKSLLATLGIGTGARIAVASLSKLIPGWGSFVGASTAYATTYALGRVVVRYLEAQGKLSLDALMEPFRKELEQGKAQYEASREAIAQQREVAAALEKLGKDLRDGKITQEDFDRKTGELVAKL
jgi:uncharacterized protein (DUF697 family)/tellurite resistance protein